MNRDLKSILFAAVIAAIGLASGYFAAVQDVKATDEVAKAGAANQLSEQTLRNLGVTIAPAKLVDYAPTVKVQAIVEDSPQNQRPLPALLGGIVTEIHVRRGDFVKGGTPIATLVRAPIARPKLELTMEIVALGSEALHQSIASLRTAVGHANIARRELDRIEKLTRPSEDGEMALFPRKRLIELEYEVARSEQERKNAEFELSWHGLSPEEIESIRDGDPPPPGPQLWRRALEKNSLWGDTEQRIFDHLPKARQSQRWVVATIGELSAAGMATPELEEALKANPALSDRFIEAASLLLDGHTLSHVLLIAASGALEPTMVLRAPSGDWDVESIDVRQGQKIDAGSVVARLHDPRRMWLRLEPIGDEVGRVAKAFQLAAKLNGRPIVAGSGPMLQGLTIQRLATRSDAGARAYVEAANEPILTQDGTSRSWRLRVGLRYLVEVPTRESSKRFVLPAGAVTDMGPERIIYLEDGNTFRDVVVHVEYLDDEIAVLGPNTDLFEGDRVVMTGAFALGLALQADTSAVDPHAGHNH